MSDERLLAPLIRSAFLATRTGRLSWSPYQSPGRPERGLVEFQATLDSGDVLRIRRNPDSAGTYYVAKLEPVDGSRTLTAIPGWTHWYSGALLRLLWRDVDARLNGPGERAMEASQRVSVRHAAQGIDRG